MIQSGAMPQTTVSGFTRIGVPDRGQKRAENDPKQPVQMMHGGSRLLAFEERQLLSEGGNFQREILPR